MIRLRIDQGALSSRQRLADREAVRIGRRTARWCHITEPCVADVCFVSEAQMRKLHVLYDGSRVLTDVLSFEALPPCEKGYLGEIFLYYPRAVIQAKKAKHPVAQEVAILVAHGLLHLLGYDHDTPKKQAVMFSLQEHICAP